MLLFSSFHHMHELMKKCKYDGFMALYFREQRMHWQDDKWRKINKEEQEIVNRRIKVTALLRRFIFHQKLPVLMWVCQHVTEVEHPSVWQELVSECVLSPKQSLNQLWRKRLFLPPFSVPCYSFYLLTLTSSTLKLPHCWCSGSTFPNINLTHVFSCFYISPCSFFPPAVSFPLPGLIGKNHVVVGLRDDSGWDMFPTLVRLFGKSPAGVAIWMCWEMTCDAWTHHCM